MVERRRRHWFDRWGGIAVVVAVLAEILAASFWAGQFDGRLQALQNQMDRMEQKLDAHQAAR